MSTPPGPPILDLLARIRVLSDRSLQALGWAGDRELRLALQKSAAEAE